jgi:hypothetical protein
VDLGHLTIALVCFVLGVMLSRANSGQRGDWKASEPAKYWGGIVVTLVLGLVVSYVMRRSDQRMLDLTARREYEKQMFEYRKAVLDDFAREITPAISRTYRSSSLQIWLMCNTDDKARYGRNWNQVYQDQAKIREEMEKTPDASGLCMRLYALCRDTDGASDQHDVRPMLQELATTIDEMTDEPPEPVIEKEWKGKLESARERANSLVTYIVTNAAKILESDRRKLDATLFRQE